MILTSLAQLVCRIRTTLNNREWREENDIIQTGVELCLPSFSLTFPGMGSGNPGRMGGPEDLIILNASEGHFYSLKESKI